MIRVDESDPVGEIEPSFPYRDVTLRRGIDFKTQYDIQVELGRGKFGTVFRCKDKKTGLSLAAKVVNIAKKEDRRCVEREVEIMRRLQHPRLIQLYDAIDNGKHIYVILELIEGGELFERVIDDDFVLTERSCAVFMRQICEGMEFVHSQFILHLDMKPENILCLTKEGNRIKIIDFGLARKYDPSKKLQVLFGTPEFVAPEVVNFDQIGFGTDMWSIGVICYVLLSGLSPFMGDTDLETMGNVTKAKYDFDHEAFANISEDAKDFIQTLLIKDIENRATATQCREHRWLARKNVRGPKVIPVIANNHPQNNINNITINNNRHHLQEPKHELDMTKDNLRLFVERWREHPDSPYTIDPKCEIDSSRLLVSDSDARSVSLRGQSPSPCGSICSSDSFNDNSFYRTPKFNLVDRRASDSATSDKHRDPATQIILANEIIKLSEHLRTVAQNSGAPNEDHSKKVPSSSVKKKTPVPTNEIAEKLSSIARQRKINGTTFNGTRKYETNSLENNHLFSLKKTNGRESNSEGVNESIASVKEVPKEEEKEKEKEMDLIPPWRKPRTKHKFSELGRDVPRITNLQDLHKNLNLDEPSSTKNLLLQLLNEWDDVSRPTGIGRKSISFDWCAEDVARRSLNSLAEYFHVEQQKAATAGGAPSASSVHR